MFLKFSQPFWIDSICLLSSGIFGLKLISHQQQTGHDLKEKKKNIEKPCSCVHEPIFCLAACFEWFQMYLCWTIQYSRCVCQVSAHFQLDCFSKNTQKTKLSEKKNLFLSLCMRNKVILVHTHFWYTETMYSIIFLFPLLAKDLIWEMVMYIIYIPSALCICLRELDWFHLFAIK